jgi:outer membrane lipoprotein-sorting protein
MSTLFPSRRLRWAVPGGVAAAVAVASLASTVNASASGRPKLPTRSAAQLLADLEKAAPPQLSGTVVESVHLGLPDLSAVTGASSASSDLSMQNLVSGSHTLRVFYGGPTRQRVALLGQLSESDVVHNGTDLWTYSSTTREVTHSVMPKADVAAPEAVPGTAADLTPMASAEEALKAIDPTTRVTIDRTAYVAGRSAYQVVLTPKDRRSLVGSVRIALDSATSIPLRVQVFAKNGKSPSMQIGFTDITFAAPSASVFRFVPPAGIKPKEQALPLVGSTLHPQADPSSSGITDGKVLGTGWTAVLQAAVPKGATPSAGNAMLDKIATPVDGGRLITSALLSVLMTNDGRVLVGPVSGADLQKIAASGHGL